MVIFKWGIKTEKRKQKNAGKQICKTVVERMHITVFKKVREKTSVRKDVNFFWRLSTEKKNRIIWWFAGYAN